MELLNPSNGRTVPHSFISRQMPAICSCVLIYLACCAVASRAQTVGPAFSGVYGVTRAGLADDYPFVFEPGNNNKALFAESSRSATIDEFDVLRGPDGHITGFGNPVPYATADGPDGGRNEDLAFAPNGALLFTASFDQASLGQIKPGSRQVAKLTPMTAFGFSELNSEPLGFVPAGLPGAGRLKLIDDSNWFDAAATLNADGTCTIAPSGKSVQIGGNIRDFLFVPGGPPLMPNPSVIIVYESGEAPHSAWVYELDSNGDPVLSTKRLFMENVQNALNRDPVTGDFLFFSGDPAFLFIVKAGAAGTAPVISVRTPSDGVEYSIPAEFAFEGTAFQTNGTITSVKLYRNGALVETLNGVDPRNEFFFGQALSQEGAYAYAIVATGSTGLSSTSSVVNVNVSRVPNVPPQISFTALSSTNLLACAPFRFALAASDSDGTITSISISEGTNRLVRGTGSTIRSELRELSIGTHLLTAEALDNRGGRSVASLTVNVAAPALHQLSGGPGNDDRFHLCFSGTAGTTCVLDATVSLSGSTVWAPLATNKMAGPFLTLAPETNLFTGGRRMFRMRSLP